MPFKSKETSLVRLNGSFNNFDVNNNNNNNNDNDEDEDDDNDDDIDDDDDDNPLNTASGWLAGVSLKH